MVNDSVIRNATLDLDRRRIDPKWFNINTSSPYMLMVADINKSPIEMLGHVTSSYYSPNLQKSIALAVVRGGKNMMGQKLIIPMEKKNINVTVADPVFLDKENKRLNA